LKFPLFLPAGWQEKSAKISKLVDDEASSILETKNKSSLTALKPYLWKWVITKLCNLKHLSVNLKKLE